MEKCERKLRDYIKVAPLSFEEHEFIDNLCLSSAGTMKHVRCPDFDMVEIIIVYLESRDG